MKTLILALALLCVGCSATSEVVIIDGCHYKKNTITEIWTVVHMSHFDSCPNHLDTVHAANCGNHGSTK